MPGPEDQAKYEEMLAQLASEYPELEEAAMDLSDSILDLDAPDIGEDDLMDEDLEAEEDMELSLDALPEEDDMEIPAELLDEEEDEDEEEL